MIVIDLTTLFWGVFSLSALVSVAQGFFDWVDTRHAARCAEKRYRDAIKRRGTWKIPSPTSTCHFCKKPGARPLRMQVGGTEVGDYWHDDCVNIVARREMEHKPGQPFTHEGPYHFISPETKTTDAVLRS